MKQNILFLLVGFSFFSHYSSGQSSGNCLSFDGNDDFISCPLPSLISSIASSDFTMEVWVKPESTTFSRVFYAQSDLNNFATFSLTGILEPIFYIVANGNNFSIQSTQQLPFNTWSHVAITWDASASEPLIYINGGLAPLAAGIFVSSTATDNIMTIGSRTDGAQLFTGEIDEFSVWDVVKSECEIARKVTSKRTGVEAYLSRYYNFDLGVPGGANSGVSSLIDQTGNSANGTLNNFTLSGSTSNWMNSGVTIDKYYANSSSVTLVGQSLVGQAIFNAGVHWINCDNNALIPGASNTTFNPILDDPNYNPNGVSYAMFSSNVWCYDTTECFFYSSLSLSNLEEKSFSLYPNPSTGSFNVEMPSNTEEIQILSIKGELLETQKTNGKSEINMDLKYPAGVYIVRVQTSFSSIVKKITIQK